MIEIEITTFVLPSIANSHYSLMLKEFTIESSLIRPCSGSNRNGRCNIPEEKKKVEIFQWMSVQNKSNQRQQSGGVQAIFRILLRHFFKWKSYLELKETVKNHEWNLLWRLAFRMDLFLTYPCLHGSPFLYKNKWLNQNSSWPF